jgi:hypothetical protein
VTRQSRLVVTLLVIAGVGVGGLLVVANQYRKALANAPGGSHGSGEATAVRDARRVEGFLAARAAVKSVMSRYPVKIKQLTAVVTGDFTGVAGQRMTSDVDAASTYRIERFNALAAHNLTYDDYVTIRSDWRAWRSGGPVVDRGLAAAFEARRAELEAAALGPVEALDDAIK